ncbi:MAG: DUF3025 domain-containing protein, partial [Burkholderiales bacterium]
LGELPADRFPSLADINRLAEHHPARSGGDAPIYFADTAPVEGYELTIHETGAVPTRSSDWHDLFNALCWLAFPLTKAALNARHVRAIRGAPEQLVRGAARDAATLFDESGVIVASSDPTLGALMTEFQWKRLFWARRADVATAMHFGVFGHALMEKAVRPYHGMTGHAIIVPVAAIFHTLSIARRIALLDASVAALFGDVTGAPPRFVTTRAFAPLPILGVPGWIAANAEPAYYDDAMQFRAGRAR